MSATDLAAILGSAAALLTALGGVVYQIRQLRIDMVESIDKHMARTINALEEWTANQ